MIDFLLGTNFLIFILNALASITYLFLRKRHKKQAKEIDEYSKKFIEENPTKNDNYLRLKEINSNLSSMVINIIFMFIPILNILTLYITIHNIFYIFDKGE